MWSEAGKLGFLGVNLPEEYGGGGAGMYELSLVMEEMAAAGSALLLMVVSPAINGTIISKFGTEEQKKRWIPGIADGSLTMAFAITEPDAGSNSHKITTTARRDGSDWILKGQKVFISGIDQAQAVLVVARTEEAKTGKLRPALFVVPTDAPGFTYTPIEMEIISPERQFQVFLDDVRLPADALVGAEDAAIAQLFAGPEPRAHHGRGQLGRHGPLRARPGRRLRQDPPGVGHADRRAPGPVTSVGAVPHRGRTRQADDAEGRDALRQRRRRRRGRGRQHGEIRCGRSGYALGRPGRAVAGRQRPDQGVRRRRHAGLGPARPHRAGQPGDGAQLRRADVAGPAPVATDGHARRIRRRRASSRG